MYISNEQRQKQEQHAAAMHAHSRDKIDYNKDLEHLLKDNAEECESLGILHRASYEKYNRLSNYINIPVIILSSAIGFATGIDIGYSNMNIILGIGSIFVGIIKSIDTYFQLGKRSESHRLCSLQYQQIHKKIQIELALTRNQRQTAKDMLSVIKTDIKNLQDISPLVDQDIIDNYNARYGQYTDVKKPNFVNGLTEVAINDTVDIGYGIVDVRHSRPRSPAGSSGSNSGDDISLSENDHPTTGGSVSGEYGGGGGNRDRNSSGEMNRRPPIIIKPIIVHSNNVVDPETVADARSNSNHSVRSNRSNQMIRLVDRTNENPPPPPNLSAGAENMVLSQPPEQSLPPPPHPPSPPQILNPEHVSISITEIPPDDLDNSVMM